MQVHATIAVFTIAEMAIDENEADELARALHTFDEHYGINVLTEKQMAALGLGIAAFKVYGKRVPYFLGAKSTPAKPSPVSPIAAKMNGASPPDPPTPTADKPEAWFQFAPPPIDHAN